MPELTFDVEQITIVSPEVIAATTQLVLELGSSNQMAVTKENLDKVAQAPDQVWLAARVHDIGKIVGMAVLATPPTLTNVRCELLNLVVDPEYRRHGIAEVLVQRALEEAEARDVNTVHLEAGRVMLPATACFRSLAQSHVK